MKRFLNILDVWRHEFIRALSDEGVVVFFLVLPLLYPLLYAYLYSEETVREVPTVVVDNCKTSMSREFLRKVNATADIKIIGHCANMKEAEELIHQHEAYGLIYIPAEFEKQIINGEQAVIETYNDMSGLLYYKAILSACTEVSLEMNKDIKTQRLVGATDEQASTFAYPIKYEYIPLFNTQSGFATFLIPAVLMMIIQQSMLLGVGMLQGDERERRRRGIVDHHMRKKRPLEILIGKAGVYLNVYIAIALYLVCIVPQLFDLIHIWQWQDLFAFLFPFLLACVFFTMFIASMAYDRETYIVLFVFLSIPLLFISGISWPASSIPDVWKYVSYLVPSTFGINGYVRISEMGALLKDVQFEFIGLWIQAIMYFFLAWFSYRRVYRRRIAKN